MHIVNSQQLLVKKPTEPLVNHTFSKYPNKYTKCSHELDFTIDTKSQKTKSNRLKSLQKFTRN